METNSQLILDKATAKFGTMNAFCKQIGVDRSTVHRWLRSRSLPNSERLLQIAAALDIDPMALWNITPSEFEAVLPTFTRIAREGSWKSHFPALAFAENYLFPAEDWPPASIPARYGRRGRKWHLAEFRHDPATDRQDYYCSLMFEPVNGNFERPQIWHFAYKEAEGPRQATWLPYGAVRLMNGEIALFNYIGEAESVSLNTHRPQFIVQTHLGRHKIDFRIASLHCFEMAPVEDANCGTPTVGFRYPGPR